MPATSTRSEPGVAQQPRLDATATMRLCAPAARRAPHQTPHRRPPPPPWPPPRPWRLGGAVAAAADTVRRVAGARRHRQRRRQGRAAAGPPMGGSGCGDGVPQLGPLHGRPSQLGSPALQGGPAGRSARLLPPDPMCCRPRGSAERAGAAPGRRARIGRHPTLRCPAPRPLLQLDARSRQPGDGGPASAGQRRRAHRTTAAVASSRSSARCRHFMVPGCWGLKPRAIGLQLEQTAAPAPHAACRAAGGTRATAAQV